MACLRIYYLGAGEIAVPVLKKLLEADAAGRIVLAGIGTQPDRPAGRKQQLMPTPVGAFAAAQGIEIDKFTSINSPDAIAKIAALEPDFLVVASYGQLLKQPILDLPKIRCINVHASLLPKYRGASPIAHAILNCDAETGVSFMDMELGLDSGRVFDVCKKVLDGTEYAEPLEIELGEMAGARIVEVLEKIADGTLAGTVQNPELVTITKKMKKSDGVIDWTKPAKAIEALIRAYTPWPGVSFALGEKRLALSRARVIPAPQSALPGEIVQADRKGWVVACGADALELLEVIPPGKKPMAATNFLNGCRESLVGMRLQ